MVEGTWRQETLEALMSFPTEHVTGSLCGRMSPKIITCKETAVKIKLSLSHWLKKESGQTPPPKYKTV